MKIIYFVIISILTNPSFAIDLSKISNEFIDQYVQTLKTPGLSIAIIDKGEVVNFRPFGRRDIENNLPVEKTTLFRIGSLTKTFTAAAIMLLQERGLLRIDDLVEQHIPELKDLRYPYTKAPRISLRDLLTHSSGLIRHPQPEDQSIEGLIQAVLEPISFYPFVFDENKMWWYPGYRFHYSNVAIALLGEVVARVSQNPVDQFIKKEILEPLGMNSTYWHESELPSQERSYAYNFKDGQWVKHKDWDLKGYSAAGSIYSNVGDLAKWMNLQFKSSPQSHPEILNPFILEKMHRVQALRAPGDQTGGVGLVWQTNKIQGREQVGHNGATGGYMANFSFDKEIKIGVVVLASNGVVNVTSFGEKLLSYIQKAINDERVKKFYPIAKKLIPYLQLKYSEGYNKIFDATLYDARGSDEKWREIFNLLEREYGKVKKLVSIETQGIEKAKLHLKTDEGILTYKITLSSTEKGKLSGIRVLNFNDSDLLEQQLSSADEVREDRGNSSHF